MKSRRHRWMPRRRSHPGRKALAYHKAGHALAGYAMGLEGEQVTIIPGEGSLGRCRCRDWDDEEADGLDTALIVIPAGALAEEIAMGAPGRGAGEPKAMTLHFHELGIGPIVGKRTWGGLAGAFDIPALMDGGTAEVPTVVLWGPGREGEVENHGVAPDIEVEFDPEQVRKGHDPQLQMAIQTMMAALRKNPVPRFRRPRYCPGYLGAARPRVANGTPNSASTASM